MSRFNATAFLDTSWAIGGSDPAETKNNAGRHHSAQSAPTPNGGNQGSELLPGLLGKVDTRSQTGGVHLHGRSQLDSQQDTACDLMQSGNNTFLTGMAGTGKSHTLISFIGQSFRRIDACATTGIAALNLQDQFMRRAGVALAARTVYSWSGIGLGPAPGQTNERYFEFLQSTMSRSRSNAYQRIRRAECLIIDEISMLPGRVFDYLDFHMRQIRESDRPFGGVQMIVVGDFCQLPPVAKNQKYDWVFMSQAWQRAKFYTAYLTTIHRQADQDFAEALNSFRVGSIGARVSALLAKRVRNFVDRRVVRLMTHNAQVDKWNSYQIGEIDHDPQTYTAQFTGPEHEADFLCKNSITPATLELKPTARVMVTTNLTDPIGGGMLAVNGQCGEVLRLGPTSVDVRLDTGDELQIGAQNWQFDPQRDDSATMSQIPLRPAYAMTIHKSQGLTLDRAHIDIRAAREPGQAYVALSRLRSLSGLYLKEWIKGVHVSEAAINFYKNVRPL